MPGTLMVGFVLGGHTSLSQECIFTRGSRCLKVGYSSPYLSCDYFVFGVS